jgi:hypothetical protein
LLLFLLLPDITELEVKIYFKNRFSIEKGLFEGARLKIESFEVITDSKDMCFTIKYLTKSNKGHGPKLASFG